MVATRVNAMYRKRNHNATEVVLSFSLSLTLSLYLCFSLFCSSRIRAVACSNTNTHEFPVCYRFFFLHYLFLHPTHSTLRPLFLKIVFFISTSASLKDYWYPIYWISRDIWKKPITSDYFITTMRFLSICFNELFDHFTQ